MNTIAQVILDDASLRTMRHSCSHLFAAAVKNIWPDAKFGVGPATKDGFYYDIDLPQHLSIEDFPRIEEEMGRLKKARLPFERIVAPIEEATAVMAEMHQDYKVDLLALLRDRGTTSVAEVVDDDAVVDAERGLSEVSLYRLGDFVDLCTGPHVPNTGEIGVFKLISIAGAYWRGDAKNPQLQRVYGLCYRSPAELDHRLWQLEEMKKRDHRRIGKDMKLFVISDEVGSGLPLWLPRGKAVRDELELLARQVERRHGYQSIATPQLARDALYYRSRHLPYYAADMYSPIDIEGDKYYLRPMNCPHHHMVYKAELRSYRDLPLRLAEYGQVYRYEASGSLSGLMRTRGFCQNDAHIYCTYGQAKDEFLKVMRLHAYYYELLRIENYAMRLSLPDLSKLGKYVDEPDKWRAALDIIVSAMHESGLPYREAKGEAAFYGPKIDFMIESALGNEFAISTNQLDFLATETFDLTYTAEDGTQKPVYVIHRSPLGSHERFVAFLIEHYGGAFPTWLAPIQARVIPISDRHVDYARAIESELFQMDVPTGTGGLRIDVDDASDRMQKKIRNAQLEKIPYMLVVGDTEVARRSVSVRTREGEDMGAMPLVAFATRLVEEVRSRRNAT